MTEKVQDNYEKLSDVEHVLLRPGMYIGSITSDDEMRYVFNEDIKKFEKRMIKYNPGFLKLFDEIISNSVDESKRKGQNLQALMLSLTKRTVSYLLKIMEVFPLRFIKRLVYIYPHCVFQK